MRWLWCGPAVVRTSICMVRFHSGANSLFVVDPTVLAREPDADDRIVASLVPSKSGARPAVRSFLPVHARQ